jgi:hypothetical protein
MCLQQPSRLIKLLRFQQSIPYNNSWNFVQRCLKMDIDLFIDVSLLLLPHGISDLNSKPTKQWWSKTCVLFCFFLVYRECLYAPYFQIIFIDNIFHELNLHTLRVLHLTSCPFYNKYLMLIFWPKITLPYNATFIMKFNLSHLLKNMD